ncbi:MAG: hypothetical protein M3227_00800 [Thermoproteota archaeon]|nr:hypothetical protein [Thermoproteota archaeon]
MSNSITSFLGLYPSSVYLLLLHRYRPFSSLSFPLGALDHYGVDSILFFAGVMASDPHQQ